MGTSVTPPDPRNYGQETRDTLQSQIDLAPQKFASEQRFAPQYQQMQLDMLRQSVPQLMGMYSDVAPSLSQIEMGIRSSGREADIADFAKLGPAARAAQASVSPNEAGLVDSMVADAKTGLAAGSSLTPEMQRAAQQQSRQAFAARGLANNPSSAVDEIVRSQAAGNAMKQQRMNNASGALAMSKQFYGDPFQQTLGRSSGQAFGMAPGITGQAQGFNPGQIFNPESQMAGDIYNQGWQGTLAARTATGANRAAVVQGVGTAFSGL